MRIGTWNLAGRWDSRHSDLLSAMSCDVLLLTEVSDRVALLDMEGHVTEALMAPRRRWSGVFSRMGLTPLPDPHGASAAARIGEQTFCSSILPWRSCGIRSPWVGTTTAAKTAAAIASLRMAPPDVWGGDWNHALSGKEYAGSLGGRAEIEAMTAALGLSVATAAQPHRIEGLLSIDHIAIPTAWRLTTVERHVAEAEGVRISDHDAYVVEVDPTAS